MNGLSQWDKLKYLYPDDKTHNWGDPHQFQREFLLKLDAFARDIGNRIVVIRGFDESTEIAPGELYHRNGRGVDLIAPGFKGHILDMLLKASKIGFGGIGLHRDWEYKGKPTKGLHLDDRDTELKEYWVCHHLFSGKPEYSEMTFANLKAHEIL